MTFEDTCTLKRMRPGHAVLVHVCPFCGQVHESPVFTTKKWEAWLRARAQGAHVQNFWPELSPAEREEFFLSGMCDACWKKTFPSGEDEP